MTETAAANTITKTEAAQAQTATTIQAPITARATIVTTSPQATAAATHATIIEATEVKASILQHLKILAQTKSS